MNAARCILVMMVVSLLAGCGSDFKPPSLDTTGAPASPLGQVVDLEVTLPDLLLTGTEWRGVELELRFEIEQVGFGRFPAHVTYGRARFDRRSAEIEDLSNGRTVVTIAPDTWVTGLLGPLRIEGTVFDLLLGGETTDGGWTASGIAAESLTATQGVFQGWRRHRFLLAGTDFFSEFGRVSEVALIKEGEIVVRNNLDLVSSDPVLRVTGRSAFAINRFTFDNLQRLDPESDFVTSWQAGVGAGANPHDVLVVSEDKGYVTRYEPPYDDVAIFNPLNGQISSTIPLTELAENEDGTPRADTLAFAADTLFVALQDIDRSFVDYFEGKLATIDPTLDEIVGMIPLGGKNPSTIEVLRGEDGRERLYVAMAGIFPGFQPQELSGGVVVIDAINRAVERMALDDDDAGGNIVSLAMVSEALGYVVVTDEAFTNRVLAFDPSTGEVLRTVWETTDFVPEIEVDTNGVLAIPDRSFFTPRLCLYRIPTGDEEVESAIGCAATELPPFSLEALD